MSEVNPESCTTDPGAIEVMAPVLKSFGAADGAATAALRALLAAGWRLMPPPSELERMMMDEGLI